MTFVKPTSDTSVLNDQVFVLAQKAKEDPDPNKIDATLGSLLDEKGELLTYQSVFKIYDSLDDKIKASYAKGAAGNQDFLKAVDQHVLEDRIKLYRRLVATSGGTGAISLTFKNMLETDEAVLLPHIAWGSYQTIAKDYGLKTVLYDAFSIDDLILKAKELSQDQDSLLMVINSPAHNPTGMSFKDEEWQKLISALKEIDKPNVILNDIAYLDYCYDLDKGRSYLECFNDIGAKTMVVITFSLSKTFTFYGLRTGADIIIAQDAKAVDETANVFERSCRALWSNVNNAAMACFVKVMQERRRDYIAEKDQAIRMLEKRSQYFLKELSAAKIPFYPYEDGFFVTLSFEDNKKRDEVHTRLLNDHIYALKVNKGIRIAICSVPFDKLPRLADSVKNAY